MFAEQPDLISEYPTSPDDYNVRTEYFEGPLDLLLHLIKKNKMDIMNIRISEITSEYLFHLKDKTRLNPSREGDFLMTASTLIYIKSRSLLPRLEILEEESPEEKLIHTLIEYEKIQKITKMLKELEGKSMLLWKREDDPRDFGEKEYELEEISSFQLAEVFLNIVKKKDVEDVMYLDSKEYSIESKWVEILELMEDNNGFLDFAAYVETLEDIQDILVSFFTILEMMKQRVVMGVQKKRFAPISLFKTEPKEEDEKIDVKDYSIGGNRELEKLMARQTYDNLPEDEPIQ